MTKTIIILQRNYPSITINFKIKNKLKIKKIEYITKKDLLYSIGNSTQYSVITQMEKEFEKE